MTKKKYIFKGNIEENDSKFICFEKINCLTNKEAQVVYFTVTDKTQHA